ncbi:hypothetical protein QT327_28010 [Olivibacter sp. 47]|uniref:hypothetical protein n=1 Tax=Olivibacter sp. 47 TaxID=3056486 RepID=UPI0025A446DD|nr:hypothetical protein [Olivibacter sp. 47]MDM8178160.1 hypothetical protein [Olivibacter sp. 47]
MLLILNIIWISCSISSRFVPINVYAQPGMFGADVNRAMSVQNLRFNTLNYANRAWVYNGESLPQHKYTYDVELKDGTKEKISSKIYMDTVTRQAYLLRLDTKKREGNQQIQAGVSMRHKRDTSVEESA